MSDDPGDLKKSLRKRLLRASEAELCEAIFISLRKVGRQRLSREILAAEIARDLAAKGPVATQRQVIERLIDNRPVELDRVVCNSGHDECQKFAAWLRKTGWRAPRRKNESPEQRAAGTAAAKARYERSRATSTRARPIGTIQQQFAAHSTLIFWGNPYLPPWGPCLDDIFASNEVRMADGLSSLTSLFGLSRKLLPHGLPRRRLGRTFGYDYRAVLICMVELLRRGVWLADPGTREAVLRGVLMRAEEKASADVAGLFRETMAPFLE